MINQVLNGNKVNTGVVSVLDTATLIRPANPRRVRLTVQNVGAAANHEITIGGPDVVNHQGVILGQGTAANDGLGGLITSVSQGAVWGIADTAATNLVWLEEVQE